ncbi:uncharacterized protein V1516DRAFT_689246 [Lipomyces oligophaga]|uniref:uncharacterized protein n=1 Tax=Lipomyces oligophaga TaxID=45792 RepID=UPI0034CD5ED9
MAPNINVPMLSLSLLEDLLQPVTHDLILSSLAREKRSRQPCVSCGAIHNSRASTGTGAGTGAIGKGNFVCKPGVDIYGHGKQQSSDSIVYFACLNCSRKIASSRYAAHLQRCLGGRASRNKSAIGTVGATSTVAVASPMSMSMSPSSPYITDDDSPPTKNGSGTSTKKRKLGNGISSTSARISNGTQYPHKQQHIKSEAASPAAQSDPGTTTARPDNGGMAGKSLPGARSRSDKTVPGSISNSPARKNKHGNDSPLLALHQSRSASPASRRSRGSTVKNEYSSESD